MSTRRLLRIFVVVTSNGILFYFAMRALRRPSEVLFWRASEVVLCAGSLLGVSLEVAKHKVARILNVGVPAVTGIVLASSVVWLPMLAQAQHSEHPTDAYEAAPFLLVFSLVPFFLACTVELADRLLDIA